MTAAVLGTSPLRLPGRPVETACALPADGLRSRLEQLTRQRFNGRMELRADEWVGELLFHQGRPMAAAFGGRGVDGPLAAQEAFALLLNQAAIAWECRLEPMSESFFAPLAGLGKTPEVRYVGNADEFRTLLRDLVHTGQQGVLQLSVDGRWARTLIAEGRVVGSYSDLAPEMVVSLAPMGELLDGTVPTAHWFSAANGEALMVPPVPAPVGAAPTEVERHVIWIVSRFEGALGRARERGGSMEALQMALVELLVPLRRLAGELEATRGQPRALEAALARLEKTEHKIVVPLAEIDQRLEGLEPGQACPVLVELVSATLERIVSACPDPDLAEGCRQAGVALEAELHGIFEL